MSRRKNVLMVTTGILIGILMAGTAAHAAEYCTHARRFIMSIPFKQPSACADECIFDANAGGEVQSGVCLV